MRELLTLKKGNAVSFLHDMEALGCLLYELLDFFAKPNATIMVGEIHMLTRKLGYEGPISIVRRMLISQKFLTEVERGTRFMLLDANKEAIQTFFKRQKQDFAEARLTQQERGRIFSSSGIQGTPTEALLAAVMGTLALLGEYLARIPNMEAKIDTDVAKYMLSTTLYRERSDWYAKHTEALKKEFDVLVNMPCATDQEIEESGLRYMKANRHAIFVFDEGLRQLHLYDLALRDAQILRVLKPLRALLLQVTASFSKAESDISL